MPSGGKGLKVTIDTNVFVSGVTFPGRAREVLDLMVKERIEVCISPFIMGEIEKVLQEKFGWASHQVNRFIALIKHKATLVYPKVSVSVITEKDDDNRILECAIEGKVHYLVTGDKRHLLPLKEYQGVKIISPVEFLRLLFT